MENIMNINHIDTERANEHVCDEVRQRLQILATIGKTIEATSPVVDIKQKPEYFDENRYKKAQKTINKYYTSLSLGATTGLILLLQIRSILIPLLKSGQSKSVVHLWDRYTATAKYIKACYESKFFDETSEGWRHILLVRGMHKRIHQMMNKEHADILPELGCSDDEKQPIVWVNQFDMAITQFAFVGLFLLEPNLCAAYSISEEELLDIVYFWRLLSYYFGIEDRFNIFVFDKDWPKQRQLTQQILDVFYREQLSGANRQQLGLEMGKGFLLSFEELANETTFNVLDHWWSPFISISGRDQLERYTLLEQYKSVRFAFIFKVLFKNRLIVKLINRQYKKKFEKFCSNGKKIKKSLAKKYGHLKYEEATTTPTMVAVHPVG